MKFPWSKKIYYKDQLVQIIESMGIDRKEVLPEEANNLFSNGFEHFEHVKIKYVPKKNSDEATLRISGIYCITKIGTQDQYGNYHVPVGIKTRFKYSKKL